MAIKGVSSVRRKLKLTFKDIEEKRTSAAVYSILSEVSFDAAARTPIETSVLVSSLYAPRLFQTNGVMRGVIGYTAEYAGWVHDSHGTLAGQPRASGQGNYWDKDGEPRFLDKAAEYVEKNLAHRILKEAYRVE